MKALKPLLLFLFLLLTSALVAEELPALTPQGLEEYRLKNAPPTESQYPGLTTKLVETEKMEEGEVYKQTWLKFFLHGTYLGKGLIQDDVLTEIIITSPRVMYEGGFRVGSTWGDVQRVFPRPKLHYTYITDRLFADSEAQSGVQLNFAKEDYVGRKELRWEFQSVEEEDVKSTAEVKSIRIY